jgi:[ribosomal protein S5]-alanine N-acetyltransferase
MARASEGVPSSGYDVCATAAGWWMARAFPRPAEACSCRRAASSVDDRSWSPRASADPPYFPAESLREQVQPSLTTERGLLSRHWAPQDVPALVAAYDDPAIRYWHHRTMTADEAAAWVATTADRWTDETEPSGPSLLVLTSWGESPCGAWTSRSGRGVVLDPPPGARAGCRLGRGATGRQLGVGHRGILAARSGIPLRTGSCRVAVRAGFVEEARFSRQRLHEDGWHDIHVHTRLQVAEPKGTSAKSDHLASPEPVAQFREASGTTALPRRFRWPGESLTRTRVSGVEQREGVMRPLRHGQVLPLLSFDVPGLGDLGASPATDADRCLPLLLRARVTEAGQVTLDGRQPVLGSGRRGSGRLSGPSSSIESAIGTRGGPGRMPGERRLSGAVSGPSALVCVGGGAHRGSRPGAGHRGPWDVPSGTASAAEGG